MLKKVKYAKPEILCHPTSEPPVPKHQTGCSNCGYVWDWFYIQLPFMGPPNYCPRCGAMNEDRSQQENVKRPIGAVSLREGEWNEGEVS